LLSVGNKEGCAQGSKPREECAKSDKRLARNGKIDPTEYHYQTEAKREILSASFSSDIRIHHRSLKADSVFLLLFGHSEHPFSGVWQDCIVSS